MQVAIYVDTGSGYKQVDLYQDEKIEINLNVKNINDIAKVRTDFTQSFTLPCSPNNNAIFEYWYRGDVSGNFNANLRYPAYIEVMGVPFRYGKLQFEEVKVKEMVADSYSVTFYGQGVNLSDLFKDDFLADIYRGYTIDDFNYNQGSIEARANSPIGFLFVPLINARTFMEYGTGSDNDLGNSSNTIDWKDFKPAVLVKSIFYRIQEHYGITFSNDFLSRDLFNKLYLWLSKDSGPLVEENNYDVIKFTTFGVTNPSVYTWGLFLNPFTTIQSGNDIDTFFELNTFTGEITYDPINYPTVPYHKDIYSSDPTLNSYHSLSSIKLILNINTGTSPIYYKINLYKNNNLIQVYDNLIATQSLEYIDYDISSVNKYYYEIISYVGTFVYTGVLEYYILSYNQNTSSGNYWVADRRCRANIVSGTTIGPRFIVANNFPQMKVKDFFVSFINMYNLVLIPTSETSYYLNTLNNWHEQGQTFDISIWVDTKETTLKRVPVKKLIEFKYQKPTAILNVQYFENYNLGMGDLRAKFDVDADELKIESSFENMMFERLVDQGSGNATDIQVGFAVDKNLNQIKTAPILFYCVPYDTSLTRSPIHVQGFSTLNYPRFWAATEDSIIDTDHINQSLNFGQETSTYLLQPVTKSLYANYWQKYIEGIYDRTARVLITNAKINLPIVYQLKLNDRLIIGDKKYKILTIKIDLTTSDAQLELCTDVDQAYDQQNYLPQNRLDRYTIEQAASASTFEVRLTSLKPWIATPQYSWIVPNKLSGSDLTNYITIAIDENLTGVTRMGKVTFDIDGDIHEFTITQAG